MVRRDCPCLYGGYKYEEGRFLVGSISLRISPNTDRFNHVKSKSFRHYAIKSISIYFILRISVYVSNADLHSQAMLYDHKSIPFCVVP
ncbi:hypothetical protein ARMSODRAFT_733799 [Armillaria solidipes]|uniref:Uncharacterized protein n=1 Tax=Armillaria solidipes TaxID=1076256 RepID=A0A2H3AN53_9AGAR|nr:hypothetical protein ARMSODRAFT_733799 [Armillaria solidipes]